MSNYVLDQAFRVEESNGIERRRVVIFGDNAGGCKYPPAANAFGVLGITVHSQTRAGKSIAVRRLGIAPVEVTGPVVRGDFLTVADNQGRAQSAPCPSVTTGAGEAGLRWRLRRPSFGGHASAIQIAVSGSNTPLSITVTSSLVRVDVETDGSGDPAVNAHAIASQIVRVTLLGETGSGSPGSVTASFSLNFQSINAFAIAQEDASSEGDVINAMLIQG
jgi:hypothetical protein